MSRVLPILFNTDMVRAILNGRKTVTRRVIKKSQCDGLYKIEPTDWNLECLQEPWHSMTYAEFIKSSYTPPYQPGDILYVRESVFQGVGHYLDVSGETVSVLTNDFEYYADGLHEKDHWKDKYERTWMHRRPSIHMPKEAARIWLKVTDVRVEKLQEITPQEAWKEGAICSCMSPVQDCAGNKTAFIDIWNSTIKKSDLDRYGWDANPWVWVIEF